MTTKLITCNNCKQDQNYNTAKINTLRSKNNGHLITETVVLCPYCETYSKLYECNITYLYTHHVTTPTKKVTKEQIVLAKNLLNQLTTVVGYLEKVVKSFSKTTENIVGKLQISLEKEKNVIETYEKSSNKTDSPSKTSTFVS